VIQITFPGEPGWRLLATNAAWRVTFAPITQQEKADEDRNQIRQAEREKRIER
jgi:hypothetical protein